MAVLYDNYADDIIVVSNIVDHELHTSEMFYYADKLLVATGTA